jgi:hypothetical protein
MSTRHHCLGRCATGIYTGATELIAFNESNFLAGSRQATGKGGTCLARANDD